MQSHYYQTTNATEELLNHDQHKIMEALEQLQYDSSTNTEIKLTSKV